MISIIVPVYNAGEYVVPTIKSILKQTYVDFELIIVDDGSTDDSYSLCKKLSETDSRIVLVQQNNKGVSAARNTGIDKAKGDYICFIDADDFVEENMLECLVKNAKKNNADISSCGLVQINLYGQVNDGFCDGRKALYENKQELMRLFFTNPTFKEVLYGPYNKIIRSEIVKKVRFNESFTVAEDLLFNFECIENANSFFLENVGLYKYIKRENSISTSKFSEKEFHYIYVADILLEKCSNTYFEIFEYALLWNFQQKLNICRRLFIHKDYKNKYKDLYKKWNDFLIKNRCKVWKKITLKNKFEYIILRFAPFVFRIIFKVKNMVKKI